MAGADRSAARAHDPSVILDDPRFVLLGELASGEQTRVFRAYDTLLGRHIAIRLVGTSDPSDWARLQREASILSRLDHPGLPVVYHTGTTVTGAPYLATRLLEGSTLEQRLQREPPGALSLLRHVVEAADAVAHAHAAGVVHRELHPGNIFVDDSGRTLVLAWGRAREARSFDETSAASISFAGPTAGVPGYRSPEQRMVDACAPCVDVYALGAILYRLVTGRVPHPAVPSGAALDKELAGVRPELGAVIARATHPQPDARHASAGELAEELRPLLRGSTIRGFLGGAVGRGVALVALLAAVAVAGTVLFGIRVRPREAARALDGVTLWTSSWGAMLLEQRGDVVRGVYEWEGGVLEGALRGEVLEFRWCEEPWKHGFDWGLGSLRYSSTPPSFAGSYHYAGNPTEGGSWTITPAPPGTPEGGLRARLAAWSWKCPPLTNTR